MERAYSFNPGAHMGPAHSERPSHYCYGWEQNITQDLCRNGQHDIQASWWISFSPDSINKVLYTETITCLYTEWKSQPVCCGSDIGKIVSLKPIVNMPVADPVVSNSCRQISFHPKFQQAHTTLTFDLSTRELKVSYTCDGKHFHQTCRFRQLL